MKSRWRCERSSANSNVALNWPGRIEDIAREKSEKPHSRTPGSRTFLMRITTLFSHAQRRCGCSRRWATAPTAYNMPDALLLEGDIDREALEHAFRQLGATARISCELPSSSLTRSLGKRYIYPGINRKLSFVDLTAEDLRPEERARELARRGCSEALRSPTRAADQALSPEARSKTGTFCYSTCIISSPMTGAWPYSCASLSVSTNPSHQAGAFRSPPLSIQYRDYAIWQNRLLESDAAARSSGLLASKTFRRTSGPRICPTDLPARPSRPTTGKHWLSISGKTNQGPSVASAASQNVSLFMTLVAVVKVLLHRYYGSDGHHCRLSYCGKESCRPGGSNWLLH